MVELNEEEKLYAKLRLDPVLFVHAVIGATPSEQQREILESVAPWGAKVSVRSGHGIGKSTVLAWCILWFLSCFKNSRIPCTAPSSHQLEDILWPEVAKWRDKMDKSFRNEIINSSEKYWVRGAKDTQYAVARTARKENPEALQGFHDENLLFIIDEASGVPEAIFETAEGALSTRGARILMTSNPTRLDGYFYRSQTIDRELWTTLNYSCFDSPLVGSDYIETMEKRYGKNSSIYKVRVLGEFPESSDDTIISLTELEDSVGRDVDYSSSERLAGLDIGRFGDDPSALVIRQGGKIIFAEEWYNLDLMEQCGKVVNLFNERKFDRVYVDSIGLGAGVADRLKELGIPTIPVNVAETSAYNEKFNRLRDELWWSAREFFRDKMASIPDDLPLKNKLIAELSVLKYKFTSSGKIKAEGKDELKARLGSEGESPNLADALNLTFVKGGRYDGAAKAREVHVESAVGWT